MHASIEATLGALAPTSPQPFSARVRLATRVAHQRLEDTAVMRDLMAPDLTPANYLSTLLLWERCWQPIEAELAAGLQRGMPAALMPARRLHFLQRDIAYLQTQCPQANVASPSTGANRLASAVASEHGWYGLAYVVQGSLLGGSLVRTRLMKSLGLVDHQGTEFFAGGIAPHALHLHWKSWLAQADQQLQRPTAIREAVEAADRTFAHMETVFSSACTTHE